MISNYRCLALALANYYYLSTPSTGRPGGQRASGHVTCIMHDELAPAGGDRLETEGRDLPSSWCSGAAPGWSRRPRGTMVHARPNGPMELRFRSRSRQSIHRARISKGDLPSSEVQTTSTSPLRKALLGWNEKWLAYSVRIFHFSCTKVAG